MSKAEKKQALLTIIKQNGDCSRPINIPCGAEKCPFRKKSDIVLALCRKPKKHSKEHAITLFLTAYGTKDELVEILI